MEDNNTQKCECGKKCKCRCLPIIIIIILLIVIAIMGYCLMNKQTKNNNSNKQVELSYEEITDLYDTYKLYAQRGSGIFDTFDNNYKLVLAMRNLAGDEEETIKPATSKCKDIFSNDSKAKLEEDFYEVDNENEVYVSCDAKENEDVEYYKYEDINKAYKLLFPGDAPKESVHDWLSSYYYSPVVDGFIPTSGAGGCLSIVCHDPITIIKDARMDGKKLVISVYETGYTLSEDYKYVYMDSDKSVKYVTDVDENDEESLANAEYALELAKEEFMNEHKDKMFIYDYYFEKGKMGYYLSDIKKVK